MFGSGEQDIQLPVPIWVHLTYQTAFVDDAGKLQIRRDVYNLDSRTVAAIKSERGTIESMQERKREQEVASTSQRRAVRAAAHRLVLRIVVRRVRQRPRRAPGSAGPAAPHHALITAVVRASRAGGARWILCNVVNCGKFLP